MNEAALSVAGARLDNSFWVAKTMDDDSRERPTAMDWRSSREQAMEGAGGDGCCEAHECWMKMKGAHERASNAVRETRHFR